MDDLGRTLNTLSRRVRERRVKLDLSQQAAADASGLQLRAYQRIESGEGNPTIRTLCAVAAGLRVHVRDLL